MSGTRSIARPTIALEGEYNMPDILHKVGLKSSSLNDVYTALTTLEGLSAWWTTTTQGESKAPNKGEKQ
jgi:hypothetical protein